MAAAHGRQQPSLAGAEGHYADAAYYDLAYRRRRHDVRFYVSEAERVDGPVLEYGVGSGRVALEIARSGVNIIGIDRSRPMLSAFRERLKAEPVEVRKRVRLRTGDMRAVSLSARFRLVTAPFNAFLHLYSRRDVERFLGRVRGHLASRAWFVFDVSVPHAPDLAVDPARWFGAPRFRHPSTGEVTRYAERFDYDPLTQVLTTRMRFTPDAGGSSRVVSLSQRQYHPRELEALLHYNGFRDIELTEDFTGRPASPDCDSLVVRCRGAKA